MRLSKKLPIILYPLIFLFLVTVSAQADSAVKVKFSAPERVSMGEPFIVSLESDSELSDLDYEWRGFSLAPSAEIKNGVYKSAVMLGTSSDSKAGETSLIGVRGRAGGKDFHFSWQVRVMGREYPQACLTVGKSMVTPPEEVLSRIRRERKEIRMILGTDTPVRLWALPFEMPLSGVVTSPFGEERIFNGIKESRHGGVDLRAKSGTPIRAAAGGRVLLAGNLYFSGGSIYVDHGNGVISMYFHLSEMNVKAGDIVEKGEVIGLSGSSGRVTGPHLHFGVSIGGKMVDPLLLTRTDEEELVSGNRNVCFTL